MTALKNAFALLAAAAAAIAMSAAQAAPVSDPATLAAVDAAAKAAMAEGKTAGFTLAIASHGETIFERGYGMANFETRTPAGPETVYRIASINKQFTAAAILLLAERGKLGLDDKLSRFLPDFPRSDEISIRQLLNHTTGLHNYTEEEAFWRTRSRLDTTTDEFVSYIAGLKPLFDFEPGTKFNYSNSGYYLLGAVIEKVSGRPYPEFMADEVFRRAGMTHTAIDRAGDIVLNRASGYEQVKDKPGSFENTPFISMSTVGANGSMRSTTADMVRWHRELLAGRVVSQANLKLMLTPGRLTDGRLASSAKFEREPRPAAAAAPADAKPKANEPTRDYGFGINIERDAEGHRLYAHEGGLNGFRTRLVTYPDAELTIVFLANTGQGITNVPKSVTEILLKRLDAPGP
jgi:CubicO group peptidase (beta-lactamase class C family)